MPGRILNIISEGYDSTSSLVGGIPFSIVSCLANSSKCSFLSSKLSKSVLGVVKEWISVSSRSRKRINFLFVGLNLNGAAGVYVTPSSTSTGLLELGKAVST